MQSITGHLWEKGPSVSVCFNYLVLENHDFLKILIPLPFQSIIAPWIAKRRTPRIKQQCINIGSGPTILRWSELQGEGMAALLDELHPATAPHELRRISPRTTYRGRDRTAHEGGRRQTSDSLYAVPQI